MQPQARVVFSLSASSLVDKAVFEDHLTLISEDEKETGLSPWQVLLMLMPSTPVASARWWL
jgi:hypothetical protein